jgi:CheY-like chemotaxis protein
MHPSRYCLDVLGCWVPAPIADHRHRVLIVEDDAALRAMMATALADCDVSTASEGAEALRLAGNERPCVIFLDLMMPGMNGWQFMEQLRIHVPIPSIPIVAVTAYGSPEGLRSLGAADYLKKPFHIDVLRKMVAKHCGTVSQP